MHHVERGPEPPRLKTVRDRETPKWIDYYRGRRRSKPSGGPWRGFHGDLRAAFHGLCAYCEELCRGEVEHFRPKRSFPELAYQWSNWAFACHDCNLSKGDKWPPCEYVDPCASSPRERPEQYFEFDTQTGEILPKRRLRRADRDRAQTMIEDLDLNAWHHLRKRRRWLKLLSDLLSSATPGDPGHRRFAGSAASREAPLSSLARTLLTRMGYAVE